MDLFKKGALALGLFISASFTQAQQLTVAVGHFSPPFIYQTSNNHFYGFDISMMLFVCNQLGVECKFKPTDFADIIETVATGKADVAVSAITITEERLKKVNFSQPYMTSNCSFVTNKKNPMTNTSLATLEKQTFGTQKGNIFQSVIRAQGVKDAPIITYNDTHSLLQGLLDNTVTLIIMDTPAANYWKTQSGDRFRIVGKRFECGYGFGIAINKRAPRLQQRINNAITQYHQSPSFAKDYNVFLNFKYAINAE